MKYPAVQEAYLYNQAYKSSKHFFGRYVCVYLLKDLKAQKLRKSHPQKIYVNRLGLSVSKKVGGAVLRNRAKRIIRAGYASVAKGLCKGYLIVIGATPDLHRKKSTAIGKELKYAFEKLGILPEKNDFRDEVK